MTEAEKVEATNGNSEHKGAVTGLDKDIIKQVAYYFGDFNLPRDKFLQEKLKENSEGWID